MIYIILIGILVWAATSLLLLFFEGIKDSRGDKRVFSLIVIVGALNGVCWAIGIYGFVSLMR